MPGACGVTLGMNPIGLKPLDLVAAGPFVQGGKDTASMSYIAQIAAQIEEIVKSLKGQED